MTSETPALDALGELVPDCDICIGRASTCRQGSDGTMWCSRVRHEMPGFCIVDTHGTLTGYRARNPNEPIDPETVARVEMFLKNHTSSTAAERELDEQAAALTKLGLVGIPQAQLTALLANAIAAAPVVVDLGRDLDDIVRRVVEVSRGA